MKRNWTVAVVVLALLTWIGTVLGIKPDDPKVKPNAFCKVLSEPDPRLVGGWKCSFPLHLERGEPDVNSDKYWLYKFGDCYGLYLDRIARDGKKTVSRLAVLDH